MSNLILTKFFQKLSRNNYLIDFLLILIPFVFWIFLFKEFVFAKLPLQQDAVSYFSRIGFFTDYLKSGIYPKWDPFWDGGASFNFFLRRIGDVNPFYLLIVFSKWLNFPYDLGYRFFICFYFLIGLVGFYLLSKNIFKSRHIALISYLLFLFSSWGIQLFYNYLILFFVPIIWFFYFLVIFNSERTKSSFIGIFFCLGIIFSTYIPFFFIILFAIFLSLFLLLYHRQFVVFVHNSINFFKLNRLLSICCLTFFLFSLLPGYLFYQESKLGNFSMPDRNRSSDLKSTVAVDFSNVVSGDLFNHGYFERLFVNQEHNDVFDFFIPYVCFIILMMSFFLKVEKMSFFIFLNFFLIGLLSITTAFKYFQFFYQYSFVLKFIRNIYYFLWIGLLPWFILLISHCIQIIFKNLKEEKINRNRWLFFTFAVHFIFLFFLKKLGPINFFNYLWLLLSFISFVFLFTLRMNINKKIFIIIIFISIVSQSFYFFRHLINNIKPEVYSSYIDNSKIPFIFVRKDLIEYDKQKNIDVNVKNLQFSLYYGSTGFSNLCKMLPIDTLNFFRKYKIMLFDNLLPVSNDIEMAKGLQSIYEKKLSIAFVYKSNIDQLDLRFNDQVIKTLTIINDQSAMLRVDYFDANKLVIKINLPREKFLVINDSYDPNWSATINGKSIKILKANGAFKGVWVPKGESVIVFQYGKWQEFLTHWLYLFVYVIVLLVILCLFFLEKTKDSNG